MSPILNGKFELAADGWHQVAALGEHAISVDGPDGKPRRLVQVVDAAACASMANRFQAQGRQSGMLVDFDHFSLDQDKSSRAAGWLVELANRADGLWGRIRWTTSGKAAVEGGDYRFLSPVFDGASVQALGGGRVRPLLLAGAGVTNDPNMLGIRPLSNRRGAEDTDGGSSAAQPGKDDAMKDKLAPVLGLAADAAEDAVVAKVQDLVNRAAASDTLRARVTELEAAEAERLVAADLAEFAPVIQDTAAVKAALLANRDGTRQVLLGLRRAPEAKPADRLPNRRDGQAPTGGDPVTAGADAEKARYARIRNRTADIAKAQGLSFQAAWSLAEREVPPAA
jgi:phage I-like protein